MSRYPSLTAGHRVGTGSIAASGPYEIRGIVIYPGATAAAVEIKDGSSGAVLWRGSSPSTGNVEKVFRESYIRAESEIYVNVTSGTGTEVTVEYTDA